MRELYSLLRAHRAFQRNRAQEIGVLKGSASRPRSLSTYIMGAGILLSLIGFAGYGPLLIAGGALFVLGLAVAVIEAVFNK